MSTHPPISHSPDATPMRVLVTGGCGFIGSHLVDALLQRFPGAAITVVDDLSTGRRSNLDHAASVAARNGSSLRVHEARIEHAVVELANEQSFDRIYHLAAAVGVKRVMDDPIACIETNVGGASSILRYAVDHGKPPTLIASSSEVYGKSLHSPFSEEDDCLYGPTTAPRWSYAASKALDEYLALAHHRQNGLPVIVARIFNTVGPRQVGDYGMVLPRFIQSALQRQPLTVYGDGSQTRCFCDVRDVAPALIDLLESVSRGRDVPADRVYNLGSDQSISIGDLAGRVIEWLDSPSAVRYLPYDQAMARGFEDLSQRRPSLDRIRTLIGFEPKIQLRQTVADIADELRLSVSGDASGAK